MNPLAASLFAFGALTTGALAASGAELPRPARLPNVVLILADDLGWSDTTLFGTTSFYQTPNVQRLARRGMLFSHAYAASPLCSPTRASIMTGLSPARVGITAPDCHLPRVIFKQSPLPQAPPGDKALQLNSVTRLDTKYLTLPTALKAQGYATGHFGKWHLGPEPYSPLEHGFDVDLPHWAGPGPAGSFVAPWKFPNFKERTPKEHIEDRMAQEASEWMEKHRDKPFFLNYWQFSVHAPFDAKKKVVDKYRPLADPKNPQHSPTYAAMVESFDDAVGTLLDTIDRLGIADDTIVIFTSDNGGNMYNEVDGTSPTSNAPLRGGKATMYEGGVREPWVVAWPGHVAAESRCEEVVQTTDIFPTVLDMIGAARPGGPKFDGISIWPALQGKTLEREAIYTYFPHAPRVPDWLPPSASVHRGDWKLIRLFFEGENGAHDYRLYNLKTDLGERNNLAAQEPERVKILDAMIENFLKDAGAVLPRPNPRFDPAAYQPEMIGIKNMSGALKSKPKADPQ